MTSYMCRKFRRLQWNKFHPHPVPKQCRKIDFRVSQKKKSWFSLFFWWFWDIFQGVPKVCIFVKSRGRRRKKKYFFSEKKKISFSKLFKPHIKWFGSVLGRYGCVLGSVLAYIHFFKKNLKNWAEKLQKYRFQRCAIISELSGPGRGKRPNFGVPYRENRWVDFFFLPSQTSS